MGGRIRIMLADDAPRLRSVLREILEWDGRFCVVAEAGDGLEAVALAAAHTPDAAIVDLRMPHMSGLDAIPAIRSCSPGTAIVVMSSYPASAMEANAMEVGADAYLEKGASVSQLLATLLVLKQGEETGLTPAGRT